MANSREVYMYDLFGKYIREFESLSDASKTLGLKSVSGISSNCRGKKGRCGDYMFSYTKLDVLPPHKSVVKIKCNAENCNSYNIYGHGYCEKHYSQIRKFGKTLIRTTSDPNEIFVNGSVARVVLYKGTGVNEVPCGEFVIDSEYVDKVKDLKWYETNGYVYNRKNNLYVHRLITDCPNGYVVDHINGDKMNNIRENLRIVTPQGNNRHRPHVNPKNYYYNRANNTWCVNLTIDNRTVYFGAYKTEEEASKIALEVREKYYIIDEY